MNPELREAGQGGVEPPSFRVITERLALGHWPVGG